MIIKLLATLVLSTSTLAQHPLDFVPDDAIAVISIQDGDVLHSILETIKEQSGTETLDENILDLYLGQYFVDPSAIDLSFTTLVIMEPPTPAKGQRPSGMFGATPHLVIICKGKEGRELEVTRKSGLKTTATVDGWFIASGADQWTPRNSTNPSPILARLPDSQIGATVNFSVLWKQFGPVAKMLGGLGIGSMTRPGPDGVISDETKKAVASASKGFTEFTSWCAKVQNISVGIDFESYTIVAGIDVKMTEPTTLSIDNDSMVEMSSLLSDTMFQYAMSEKLLRKLIHLNLDSIAGLGSFLPSKPPSFLTASSKILTSSTGDNVGTYSLNAQNGITISSLADVKNQDQYFIYLPETIEEISESLLDEYYMTLRPSDTPNTWNISMNGTPADLEVMHALFPKGDQLRFGKQGEQRIAMAMGPRTWRALQQSHSTPLSQVLQKHAKNIDIDFAMSFDARSLFAGLIHVVIIAGQADEINVASSPSAKSTLMFGTTQHGTYIEITSDLYGLATLIAEMDEEKEKSRQKRIEQTEAQKQS